MLRATTASTFSTSQLPKVLREWCVLYILTWKCASRHNGVQFFISHLATWLRTRRFSEPTFRPRSHKSLEKYSVLRLCFRAPAFFSYRSFSSLIFSLLPFSSLILSTSACPSVHIVGSLTSKLPSTNVSLFICLCVCARAHSLPPSSPSLPPSSLSPSLPPSLSLSLSPSLCGFVKSRGKEQVGAFQEAGQVWSASQAVAACCCHVMSPFMYCA